MDPVAQIFAQGQLPQGGEGLGQFYFEGKRLGQQQQQINLSQQRLLLEQQQQANADAIAPYKQEALRLSNLNAGVALKSDVMKLQAMTQQNEALPQLIDLQIRMQESPDGHFDQGLIDETKQLSKQFPDAFGPGTPGDKLISNMMATTIQQRRLNQIDSARKALDNPDSVLTEYNPTTGVARFTQRHSESETPQVKNARESARLDTIINDPNASEVDKSAAQAQRNTLQQQLRNNNKPTSPLGKMLDEQQKLIDAGDFEGAAKYDKAIDVIGTGKQFAPSDLAKKMDEYQQALKDGNETVIKYYEDKLGIAGMNTETRALYKAGLQAINNDPAVFKSQDKQKLQEEFTTKFFKQHGLVDSQNRIDGGTRPALPKLSKIPVISPDGKPGLIPADQLDQALKEGFKRTP